MGKNHFKIKANFLLQVLCTCKCRSTIIGRLYVQREDEDYFTIYYPLYVLTKAIHSNQECMCVSCLCELI